MDKATSAEVYTQSNRLALELPSGFTIIIRKVPPELLPELTKGYDERLAQDWDKLSREDRAAAIRSVINTLTRIVPAVCVEPRVVIKDADPKTEIMFVDIDINDLMAIFTGCFKFSGLSEEEAAERTDFPTVP